MSILILIEENLKMRLISIVILIISIVLYPKIIETNIKVRAIIPIIQYNIKVIEIPIINTRTVKASAYNPVESQCDSTPDRMAWNDRITHQNKNKVIAVSRDLLSLLPRGTEIYFNHREVIHKKIVLDKMGRYARKGGPKRFKIVNSIDILTDNYKTARKFGVKKKKIYWFGGTEKLYSIKIYGGYIMLDGNVSNVLNYKVLELGPTHTKVETEDGKIMYLSDRKPRNETMFTDLYQLTKMCMYVLSDMEDVDTTFECFYRTNPFGGYTVALGLQSVVDYLKELHITGNDIDYLKGLWNFPDRFWEYLREFHWSGILRGVPEGSIVQPYVPIVQVNAKLPVADFVETRILNLLGKPSIVGTKALRITLANPNVPWIEMAARRSSSYDEGMLIARSAYICGAKATSLVSAGMEFGIPTAGTTSHSSVLAYENQLLSFDAHARIFGDNSVFIWDTSGNPILGVNDSLTIAKKRNLNNFGGRLDSESPEYGNLSEQSKIARKILKDNGFPNAKIVLSSDLDEYKRRYLLTSDAENDCDGVGTSLVTGPLNIVYKPVEIGSRLVIKKSNPVKTTDPGTKHIYRLLENGKIIGYLALHLSEYIYSGIYHHRSNEHVKILIDNSDPVIIEKLLFGVLVDDVQISPNFDIHTIRKHVLEDEIKLIPDMYNPFSELCCAGCHGTSFTSDKHEIKKMEEMIGSTLSIPLYLSDKLWNSKESLMKNKE